MLLTVSIPTFNGARFLEETIRSVWREVKDADDVSILIVENGSSDETPEILNRLGGEGIKFKRVTKPTTEPADLNHLSAVELAESEYVWLLGDDDEIVPGSIQKVCSELRTHRPVVAIINFSDVDEKRNVIPRLVDHTPKGANSDTALTQVWDKGDEAFLSLLEKIGVLSANCVLRQNYIDEYKRLTHSVPDGFLFMYLVAAVMLTGKTIYLPEHLMLFRQYIKRWESSELSEPLRIDYLVIPRILQLLALRGFDKKFIDRLALARSTTIVWQIYQAKMTRKSRLSLSLAGKIIATNWPNLLVPLQLVVWVLPLPVIRFLSEFYSSKLAEVARARISKGYRF